MGPNSTYYKQSGKFSPVGAVLMLLATAVCGCLLFWLYLAFEGWCTIVYLNIFAAIGVSVVLGLLGGQIVKIFKIRNTAVALICTIVGFLLATYFKWALYDYNDLKKYSYDLMKDSTAYEYYGELNNLFDETTDDFSDYYNIYHQTMAYDIFSYDISTEDGFSDSDIEKMKKQSVWEFFELDDLLGSDEAEAAASLEKSTTMNAYDYTYSYRHYKKVTLGNILTSPSDLWNDIKAINEEGRWSYRSSHSSYDNGTLVSGGVLLVVWIGEFIVLIAFMLVSVERKTKVPFIESEDDWAEYKNLKNMYRFTVPANAKQFKMEMEQNPYALFNYQIGDITTPLTTYLCIDCYVSKSGNENYLSVYQQTINPKNKNPIEKVLVKYLFVDGQFLARLTSSPTASQQVAYEQAVTQYNNK